MAKTITTGKQNLKKLDKYFAITQVKADLSWVNIRRFPLEGKGWAGTEHPYDRLPSKASGVVRQPVWDLSHHTSGMCVRFVTDASQIAARWTVRFNNLAMDHMPATGVSGLDLYVMQAGRWRWCGVGRPTQSPTNTFNLIGSMKPARRQYMLYLPLYNGVESVEIGLPRGSFVGDAPARRGRAARPICFYGTSITQGGCASRPGMVYSSILGRRLGRPTINLGFSGNGMAEPEMASLLAELDPSVYVLDPIGNMSVPFVLERIGAMVKLLRLTHRRTPIVIMEHPGFQQPEYVHDKYLEWSSRNIALRKVFKALKADGVTGMHYITKDKLFGRDGEATVDGIHATDLGFTRIADTLEPTLRPLV